MKPARAVGTAAAARLLFLLLFPLLLAGVARADNEAALKQAELRQLQTKISRLQAGLEADRQKKSRAERQLERIEEQVNQTGRALNRTRRELASLRARIGDLERQQREAENGLKQQAAQLAREARATYIMGRQQQIKLLLNQEHPSEVGRMLAYFSYFSQARQDRINAMRQAMRTVAGLKAGVERKTQALRDLQSTQQGQAERLREQQRQRLDVVARLQQRLHRQGDALKGLQADKKQLQALVESLQQLLSDIPADSGQEKPFKQLKGRLHWPAKGKLERRFGNTRGKSGLKWQGVFIAAPEGGQVRAVSQGRVAFADWMRGFGLLLIIDHGDGYMTLYGHNQALYKEVGEWVDTGEVVATLGASGGHSQAGLYFEIRHNGQPVNPVGWCAGAPAAVSG